MPIRHCTDCGRPVDSGHSRGCIRSDDALSDHILVPLSWLDSLARNLELLAGASDIPQDGAKLLRHQAWIVREMKHGRTP